MRRESREPIALSRPFYASRGGLITRAQVQAAGWSVGTLRHRIRPGGPWQAVLPGIYLGSNGPLADGQREIAAVLYAGPGCVLTGPAALRHQGVRVPTTSMVDVLVSKAGETGQSVDFVRMHRTTRMPDQTFVLNGIRWAARRPRRRRRRARRERPARGAGAGGGRRPGRQVHYPAAGRGNARRANARVRQASGSA